MDTCTATVSCNSKTANFCTTHKGIKMLIDDFFFFNLMILNGQTSVFISINHGGYQSIGHMPAKQIQYNIVVLGFTMLCLFCRSNICKIVIVRLLFTLFLFLLLQYGYPSWQVQFWELPWIPYWWDTVCERKAAGRRKTTGKRSGD